MFDFIKNIFCLTEVLMPEPETKELGCFYLKGNVYPIKLDIPTIPNNDFLKEIVSAWILSQTDESVAYGKDYSGKKLSLFEFLESMDYAGLPEQTELFLIYFRGNFSFVIDTFNKYPLYFARPFTESNYVLFIFEKWLEHDAQYYVPSLSYLHNFIDECTTEYFKNLTKPFKAALNKLENRKQK